MLIAHMTIEKAEEKLKEDNRELTMVRIIM